MKLGNTQKKILTLLMGGVAFSLSQNPKQQLKIVNEISNELKKLGKQDTERAITALEKRNYIHFVKKQGVLIPRLTQKGRRQANLESLKQITLKKPKNWDGKWRIVSFDVPEHKREVRDGFRSHLRRLEFCEIHQSLFVVPWPCENEISTIAIKLSIRENIHIIIAKKLDCEEDLREHFHLTKNS